MSDNKLIDPNYLAEIEKPHEVRPIDANALSAYLKETNWGAELLNIIDNAPTVEAYTKEQVKELIEGTVIELLERNELDEELKESELIKAYTKGFDTGVETVKNERPQGEWIVDDKACDLVTCPICKEQHCCKMNFCGNCGADMRGDKE